MCKSIDYRNKTYKTTKLKDNPSRRSFNSYNSYIAHDRLLLFLWRNHPMTGLFAYNWNCILNWDTRKYFNMQTMTNIIQASADWTREQTAVLNNVSCEEVKAHLRFIFISFLSFTILLNIKIKHTQCLKIQLSWWPRAKRTAREIQALQRLTCWCVSRAPRLQPWISNNDNPNEC